MSATLATTVGINFSTSGNQTIVAAVAGYQIILRGVALIINGATTITFNSQESTFGPFVLPSAATITLDDIYDSAQAPYAAFAAGTPLVINSSSAVQVSGFLRYSLA